MHEGTKPLCWCNGVSAAAFTAAVCSNPSADIYEIARSVNLGTKCTSCLADVEDLYISLFQSKERPDMRVGPSERVSVRRRLWNLLDRFSPKVNTSVRHLAPIIRTPTVKTIVSVTNSVAKKLGPVSTTAEVEVVVRDAAGAAHRRHNVTLRPGERLDLTASEHLDGAEAIGTARVTIRTKGSGVTGTLRPHFTVESRGAAGSVHTGGSIGALSAFHHTPRGLPGERQILFLMNCTRLANRVQASLGSQGYGAFEAMIRLAPDGAAWWTLPAGEASYDALRDLRIVSERNFKAYFMVATPSFDRISMDHL